MIIEFACKETKKIWLGEVSKRLPRNIQHVARRKLRMLNNAKRLDDLKIPPGNQLEPLKGDRSNSYSIRINKQWRICFQWQESQVFDIAIIDYH